MGTPMNQTHRSVTVEGGTIEYCLIRKKVKNVNLRMYADGRVVVSAPANVPVAVVDIFVESKSERILSALRNFTQMAQASTAKRYTDGERLTILGTDVRISVVQSKQEKLEMRDGCICVAVRDPNDYAHVERRVRAFLRAQCEAMLRAMVATLHPLVAQYGVPVPALRFREMKTRWGSCMPGKGSITFNTRLIAFPRAAIEYVVLHELCHFVHPNHSERFYGLVGEMMPDWKGRKAMLRGEET